MSKHTGSSIQGSTARSLGLVGRTLVASGFLVITTGSAFAKSPTRDLSVIYPPLISASVERTIMATSASKGIGAFLAAPMPNQNALAPREANATGPVVSPSMFQSNRGFRGDGFTPDSSPQIAQQSKRVSMPGISMKVPLY